MKKLSASLLCDFYKIAHRKMYPEGMQLGYSTWTPRISRIEGLNELVVFGHQAFIKEWLITFFNENFFQRAKATVIDEYTRFIANTLGDKSPDTSHLEELHDLGYLPLFIKGAAEGTVVPIKTPTLTIQNTDNRFFWLTNYVETLLSCELWGAYTSATIAHAYRKVLNDAARKTVGNTDFVQFQGHDFSMRGMYGVHAAVKSGMGHLTSFVGTDTIPAISGMEEYYGANIEKELVGTSIPATEHSIQCAYGNDDKYIEEMITRVHPSGFVSVVSDGYDFWDVVTRVLPNLKDKILARDGRVVIRPDSGDPVKIICGDSNAPMESPQYKGAIQCLWDIFGGTRTDKGYKLLDSHIGLIYGDAITLERAKEIVRRLQTMDFASINVVFGIGSYTYQYNTRDTLGFAMKSTLCVINGDEKQLFKDPKTDDGTKKSQKGKVHVVKTGAGIIHIDGQALDSKLTDDLLEPLFYNGHLVTETNLASIRKGLFNV